VCGAVVEEALGEGGYGGFEPLYHVTARLYAKKCGTCDFFLFILGWMGS
jgi:hypothetical protein